MKVQSLVAKGVITKLAYFDADDCQDVRARERRPKDVCLMTKTARKAYPLEAQPAVHWTIPAVATNHHRTLLPQLPLPDLHDTLREHARSLVPLLEPTLVEQAHQELERFAAQEGPALQNILQERARQCTLERGRPHVNWLEEWWERYAYLLDREPLPIRRNVASTLFDCEPDARQPLRRAALCIRGAARFYMRLREGLIAPDSLDTLGKLPLCMAQYERLFGSSRVPGVGLEADSIVTSTDLRCHVLVGVRGHLFLLRVIDERSSSGGESLDALDARIASVDAIEAGLVAILAAAARRPLPCPIAAATSGKRGAWGRARAQLVASGGCNASSVEAAEGALFGVALLDDAPCDEGELIRSALSGGDGTSVWFDKSFSFIIHGDGRVGVNIEHAHLDAPITSRMFAFVRVAAEQEKERNEATAAEWHELDFELERLPDVRLTVSAARDEFATLRASNDMVPLRVERYGRDALLPVQKRIGARWSCDSAVQMALQLAQWRDQGHLVATYETATTRRFAHGRTETIRSCSHEAKAFVEAMGRSVPLAEKREALLVALDEHARWLVACVSGRGVDRHLLGLRLAAAEAGLAAPAVLSGAAYARSTDFALSTSNISVPGAPRERRWCDYGGFGAPTVSSYGVCYGIQPKAISVLVACHAQDPLRCASRFGDAIRVAIRDVFELLMLDAADRRAKL